MPKKTPAKKTAAKKTAVAPMDDGIREEPTGTSAINRQRECWAIKQLVAEVTDLFPETGVEYSNYDGRNTALGVAFDLTGIADEDERANFALLLQVTVSDAHARVAEVIVEPDNASAAVLMRSNPRTQDIREPFNLGEAWSILTDSEPS